jgi:hypothetical protein
MGLPFRRHVMPRYKISGVDKESGLDTEFALEAASVQAAQRMAASQGYSVGAVIPIEESRTPQSSEQVRSPVCTIQGQNMAKLTTRPLWALGVLGVIMIIAGFITYMAAQNTSNAQDLALIERQGSRTQGDINRIERGRPVDEAGEQASDLADNRQIHDDQVHTETIGIVIGVLGLVLAVGGFAYTRTE